MLLAIDRLRENRAELRTRSLTANLAANRRQERS
jgi:hypothetical protein